MPTLAKLDGKLPALKKYFQNNWLGGASAIFKRVSLTVDVGLAVKCWVLAGSGFADLLLAAKHLAEVGAQLSDVSNNRLGFAANNPFFKTIALVLELINFLFNQSPCSLKIALGFAAIIFFLEKQPWSPQ